MTLPLAAPALPLDEAGDYVAGAYLVFLALILVYVAIMAVKLQRFERDLTDLGALLDERDARAADAPAGDAAGPGAGAPPAAREAV